MVKCKQVNQSQMRRQIGTVCCDSGALVEFRKGTRAFVALPRHQDMSQLEEIQSDSVQSVAPNQDRSVREKRSKVGDVEVINVQR